jgi:hypothetical protein
MATSTSNRHLISSASHLWSLVHKPCFFDERTRPHSILEPRTPYRSGSNIEAPPFHVRFTPKTSLSMIWMSSFVLIADILLVRLSGRSRPRTDRNPAQVPRPTFKAAPDRGASARQHCARLLLLPSGRVLPENVRRQAAHQLAPHRLDRSERRDPTGQASIPPT